MRRVWLFLALAAACSETPLELAGDDLAAARARWDAAGLSDYDYDFQYVCYCPQEMTRPVTVSVRGGSFTGIIYSDSGTTADTAFFADFLTMPSVFDYLELTIAAQPATFTASYDAALGFPSHVQVDRWADAVDDEFVAGVTAVRPMPGAESGSAGGNAAGAPRRRR